MVAGLLADKLQVMVIIWLLYYCSSVQIMVNISSLTFCLETRERSSDKIVLIGLLHPAPYQDLMFPLPP